jgi:hypothetical protein
MIAQSELGSSPVPFAQSPFNEMQVQVSPDGRWVAYTSDESKQHEIYVRRRDGHCDPLHVSANGGSSPRCNPRGAELFCVSLDGYLNAVLVTLRAERLEASPARPLFKVPEAMTRSPFVSLDDVAPDGQRFLTRVPERMCARCR